jgi:hypothetical protein
VLALIAAVIGAQIAFSASGNAAVAAIVGAWSETITYYVTMLLRDVHANPAQPLPITLRNLILEFGVAEALDTLLVRPALMYLATEAIGDLRIGVIVGKLASDVVFYIPAIAAFELRRRYLPG